MPDATPDPAPESGRVARWRGRSAGVAAASLATVSVAGLAAAVEPSAYPSYDYAFALASAQDVLAGRSSGYGVPHYGPVAHPLTLLEALAVAPLGDAALPAFTAFALLALGLLCWSLFRIGTTLAAWPVGLLAAALVFTNPEIFDLATRGYGDVSFAALLAAAIALELSRPRRGPAVLALLALAGLLRPEAWLLSGAYWLYLAPRRGWRERIALGGLVGLAPLVWLAMDAALTGDPLHSSAVIRAHPDATHLPVSAHSVWAALEAMAGWPVIAGAVAGGVVAWRGRRRAGAVLLAAGAATLLVTVVPAALSHAFVLRRFLVMPAVVASVLFALACLGWASARSTAWRAAGAGLAVVALVALTATREDLWEVHHERQAGRVVLLDQLHRWVDAPTPRAYLSRPGCWPVRTPGYGYRPYLRFWLDVPPQAVAFRFHDADPRDGAVLLPTRIDGYQRLMLSDLGRQARRRVLGDAAFATRFRRVARSSRWELYASPACRSGVRHS